MLFQRSTITSFTLIAATFACYNFATPVHCFAMHGECLSSGMRSPWGPTTSLKATIDDTLNDTTHGDGLRPTDADEGECVKTANILSLDSIRSTLIRQEETIIFSIIERAQFRQNKIIYENGAFGDLGVPPGCKERGAELPISFLDYMLIGTVSTMLDNIIVKRLEFFV